MHPLGVGEGAIRRLQESRGKALADPSGLGVAANRGVPNSNERFSLGTTSVVTATKLVMRPPEGVAGSE